jgi:TolB-like protein/Flp pilus assembly protein TadD
MKIDNFLNELKRRNVIRAAGLYLVGAWLLTQVASTVLPMFGAPDWLPRSIVVLLAIGFVPMLIFSWIFELTPQGLKRDEDVPAEQSIAPQTGRRMNRMIIAVLVLALGYFVVDKFVLSQRREKPATRVSSSSDPAPNEKSVAVLAFANLSDDKGSEYFSDGISEELLTVLQKIPGLHVAARTSAFSFKGKNATAQEIGQKLGVAHLVEGSVRKAGDVVRIAARLTQANTGEEQWSENYTRNLKDVFAVQTELAQTIVEQLRGQLTSGAANPTTKAEIQAEVRAAEKGGTKNVVAHEAYLQGRFYGDRNSERSAAEALVAYQRAIELDPNFALAWAGLAETHVWECFYSGELNRTTFDKHLADARDAVARALSLEPNLPEALAVRAKMQLGLDFDWKAGAETLRTALALAPTNVGLLISAGSLALAQGDAERATTYYRQAVTLDPVNPAARSFLAQNLVNTRHFAEAEAEYPRVVELNPAAPYAHAGLGLAYLLQGKFEEAVTEAQKDATEWAALSVIAPARWSQKRIPESDAALKKLKQSSADTAAYQIAGVYAYRGEKDQAFEWLERARQQRDPGLQSTKIDPLLVNLHGDPRWQAFVHTMGWPTTN